MSATQVTPQCSRPRQARARAVQGLRACEKTRTYCDRPQTPAAALDFFTTLSVIAASARRPDAVKRTGGALCALYFRALLQRL